MQKIKRRRTFINGEKKYKIWDGGYNDITRVFIGDNQTLTLITNDKWALGTSQKSLQGELQMGLNEIQQI